MILPLQLKTPLERRMQKGRIDFFRGEMENSSVNRPASACSGREAAGLWVPAWSG